MVISYEKLGYFFLIFAQNIHVDRRYSLELPQRVPTIYLLEQKLDQRTNGKCSPDIWLSLAKQFLIRRCLKIVVIYMYKAQGQEQTTPLSPNIFINIMNIK